MHFFRQASIQQKQMRIIMGICSLALLLACAGFVVHGWLSRRAEMASFLFVRGDVLGRTCWGALDFKDPKAAEENLNALKADSHMVSATVFTADGNFFAGYSREGAAARTPFLFSTNAVAVFVGGQLRAARSILRGTEPLGFIVLESDLEALDEAMKYQAGIAALVFMLASVLAFFLSSRLQRLISGPILGLLETTRAVATDRNYALRARKESADELGQLVDGFNDMLQQVQSRDAELHQARDFLEKRVEDRTIELQVEVAERRRSEQTVLESQQFLQSTLDALSAHIAILDESGGIISVNTAWNRFALANEYVSGLGAGGNYLQVCDQSRGECAEEAPAVARGIRAVLAGELEEFRLEYPCHSPREKRWFIVRVTRFGGEGVRRIVIAHENITERKHAEEKLNESLRSLAAFNAVLDRACIIATTDACGTITHANDNFCNVSEYRREELLGQNHRLVNSGHHPAEFFTEMWRSIASGAVWRGEIKNRSKSGRIYWVDTTIGPMLDEQGKPKGYLAIRTDITERKKADEERARLVDFLEASLNEVYVFDSVSLRFSYVNRSARQNLGYTAEQIGKLTPLNLKPEFTEESFRLALDPLLEGTIHKHVFQTFHRRADGTDYPVEVCLQLVTTGTERVFLAVINDTTERKRAEAELTKAQRDLLDLSRQAGMAEIATGVLHNVGNVLNSVNVSANLVSDQVRKAPVADLGRVVTLLREQGANLGAFFTSDPRGAKVPDFLARLADKFTHQQESQFAEVASLQKNIEHIKDIVAMQQSYAKVSGLTENLSPAELIEDALRMNAGSFQKHEVELVREVAADLPCVCVDKHKVLQILVNLLRNAKHACEDAGRLDKRITVRATRDSGCVRITITDNGVGIPPENLTRIFNHGFTTKKTGHGFGLHSAANAAKAMGGRLTVQSDGTGRGATFTVELAITTDKRLAA